MMSTSLALRMIGAAALAALLAPELASATDGQSLADCGLLRDAVLLLAGTLIRGRVPDPLTRTGGSGNNSTP